MTIFKAGGLAAAVLSFGLFFALPLGSEARAQAVGPALTTTLNPRGAWSPNVTYAANDLVTLRSSSWRALRASKGKLPGSTLPSTAADWALFAGGLNPIGGWKATATYQRNDLVFFNGSTWRGLRTSLNKTPGTSAADWLLFAAKGATGATGPRGLQGAQGPAGPSAVANGSASAPSFNFASSPDTGIFSPGGGKFAIAENGALFLHDIGSGNLALGYAALGINTTGNNNLAIGEVALGSNETGSSNIAIGLAALGSNGSGNFNTAVGYLGAESNTSGSRNTVLGYSALQFDDVGNDNTALGYLALQKSKVAGNTAVGSRSLANNSTGFSNTAVGYLASEGNSTGSHNTVLGYSALQLNDGGTDNTAIGYLALQKSPFGDANTGVGSKALANNTDGYYNTAVGNAALNSNTTGTLSTAVGAFALPNNSVGAANSAFGAFSLANTTTGSDNIGIGLHALTNNTEGSGNIAVGDGALGANTTGGNNTAVGSDALSGNQGAGNIAVGADAGKAPTASSNGIFIGNQGLAADTATIKIGTQGTQTSAFIGGIRSMTTGAFDAVEVLIDSNGQLGTVISSRRYKEDIQPMGAMSDMLSRLRPVSFRYRKPYADGSKPLQYGLIAEEVAEAFPYLAVYNAEGQPETVAYHQLPTFLLEGFQEQQKIIAAQAEKIAVLEAELVEQRASMEERLSRIEAALNQPRVTTVGDSR